MRRTLPLSALVLLVCAASAQAQLYKWVGPDGKVTYSDTPPPRSAASVETKSLDTGGVGTAGFPYELAEAAKNFPVTLYTTSDCAPCNDGRALLTQRGIPFTEKTITRKEDIEQFRKISSDGQFPLLQVGRGKERGFDAAIWNNSLTAAGYPQSSRLPSAYRQPQAEALAGDIAPPAAAKSNAPTRENKSAPTASGTSPAAGNAPGGFRF
jgi:glutaredoxin